MTQANTGVLNPSEKRAISYKVIQGKILLPIVSIGLAILLDQVLPRAIEQKNVPQPYFSYILGIVLLGYLGMLVVGIKVDSIKKEAKYMAPFLAGITLLFNVLNIITAKFALLPVLYFPALDRVLDVLVKDAAYLATCVAYSYRLLFIGWFFGAIVGVFTGVLLGFSKAANYWIWPFIRTIGPIPSTAWIPLVLVAFPSVVSGSAFLIALAVWFPTTVLTNSGIANINNSYFEVSATLGAGRWYQVFKVGIPAAMPSIFQGLFNGTCASFITLVTAEMLGAKYGLGWYINWQKEMMAYSNVYAGLILIAVSFCLIITVMFKIKNYLLVWQRGVIKW